MEPVLCSRCVATHRHFSGFLSTRALERVARFPFCRYCCLAMEKTTQLHVGFYRIQTSMRGSPNLLLVAVAVEEWSCYHNAMKPPTACRVILNDTLQ